MLQEIKKGIYSNSRVAGKSDTLCIAVHPKFLDYNLKNIFSRFSSGQSLFVDLAKQDAKSYNSNLENFLNSYSGPIVTFEEESKIEETNSFYDLFRPNQNNYFIKTNSGGTIIKETSIPDIVSFFNLISKDNWFMIGGYHDPEDRDGCLDDISRKLLSYNSKLPLTIRKDLTFNS